MKSLPEKYDIIKSQWKKGSLSEIAIINPPKNISSLSKNDKVSFIPMEAVSESGKLTSKYTRQLSEVSNGFTQFQDGDILFAKITPCMENGKGCKAMNLMNKTGFGSTEFHVLRPIQNNDPDFIYQHTISLKLRQKAKASMTGSAGQQRVPSDFFREYIIPIPPHPEQQKIAEVLTTIDNVIEKTEQLIEKLKSIKKGLMQDLFTRGVTSDGNLRPAPEDAPELYKESELGLIPKEWECYPLSYYLSFISYGFTNPMPEYDEGPYLLTAANIFNGKIQYETCRKTTIYAFETLLTNKSRPLKDDILITKDGTLGRLALSDGKKCCINQSIAVLRINNFAKPKYIKTLLETPKYQKTIIDEAGGSTIKHIYITKLEKMLIALPKDLDEQVKLITIIDNIDHKITFEEYEYFKYLNIKKGLMADLLTGKVRVTELVE